MRVDSGVGKGESNIIHPDLGRYRTTRLGCRGGTYDMPPDEDTRGRSRGDRREQTTEDREHLPEQKTGYRDKGGEGKVENFRGSSREEFMTEDREPWVADFIVGDGGTE